MTENKAFIPLYLNNDMINNLFTIVVQEFVESKSVNTKNQITINYRGPMSEFSDELFGKYVQGDINVQVVNEFSKQKTQASISKDIEVFMNLRKLLFKNNLIRDISLNENINNVNENDFVIMKCRLLQNPIVYYLQNLVNNMEIQNVFGNIKSINSSKFEVLRNLKEYMNTWKTNNCIKCVTTELCTPKSRFIVPIDLAYNISRFNYIGNCKINIMGKVINFIDKKNYDYMQLFGDNSLNFINENYFINFMNLNNIENNIETFSNKFICDDGNMIEVLPIAIFI
ncbi:hypothetical protein CPAST_c00920 [Clostridium pasteurianum DSM 525 = ATCC 6013]|uniref:Uncharacterized protein n=1 Tax=Clostridium pasteurianum DSM 525 = ATCC 6013 TaxID=1262449 RepID=A0A0H3J5I8_CLOPA|nr:hypothetical protein [Clostridium pasteurianum]AJA46200.1 hypothetical protein CPAST_c00920 [Clostridium pasteurianum DSM 525 = ATCC 6013]AJA50188.1 hypothetical protein CLPA_c00920 [Clostridium pasteurianum DSM 525 = ATCC 6013]AOZ73656.1 hypothetical protein AQ983_00445 [Clostridium pasteurianum DSM 525 = ATCC 6013]AOZ77453.1 hypothetical protein AQ984_00445 [Clostridium pasteurianum]ELP57459.1 hypothetical protein F502_19551 [Clostridium pasteurianum DSM 525 = ATCC 6013]